ncbi:MULTISPECIES: hypothetical protein [Bacillus]|uniref:Uncharacterized protein n=1 Tax=Bacillus amyloliquefaciens (strain ATCC 23350 / DSM 7 / BCRC 11601 / CCUG 28519 / NBRC 15535 / NRRL B-14393 / F) TaxID=692420 RepID=A0A9P1JF18_BACAS|nr:MULTISPECIES: hypothetical protein [Bacillus amyloliquefaciens group]ARW37817.1 hypothetical protein S101267_00708 [Bacillus amyloliquefaciens]AZV92064.1 hypothetical protein BUN12_3822 [Bacillus amyloliquefaciens]KYC99964.1 hypothetical protein B425_4208 [Bacillus amyloliquefaciens]MBW8280393.1 hypothetical protein [Bacillus amyloliquefaciens]MDQ8093963.1 hypothetical protein [Bacillus amyloliquefaciens]
MKKILFFLLSISLVTSIYGGTASAVEPKDSQRDKEQIKNYVENAVPLLQDSIEFLPKDSSLEKIEKTISKHYKNHPTPSAFNNPNLSTNNVFPEMKSQLDKYKGKALNINDFIFEQDKTESLGKVFTFKNENSTVKVFVGDIGDIQIIERKTVSAPKDSDDQASAKLSTRTERTTGIGYGTNGAKLFTLWAEGRFEYNGKKVSVAQKDGDYNKHFGGSGLDISVRKLGAERDASYGGYAYREVYSRIYVESVVGFKWLGVIINSKTVEAYIGAGANGAVYGGLKKI